jgi:hypothetical protein
MKQREAVLNKSNDDDDDDDNNKPGPGAPSFFVPLSSTMEPAGAVAGQHLFTPIELAQAERVKLTNRETSAFSTPHVAMLLRAANLHVSHTSAGSPPPSAEEDLTARVRTLRDQNHKLAKTIAMRRGVEFKVVNESLNRLVGIRSVKACFAIDILKRRAAIAERWLTHGYLEEAASA